MTAVLDSSALVTFLLNREGADKVRDLLDAPSNDVRIHRQNATEVRYILHRRYALAAFLAQHPERVHPNSNERPDLTGLDLDAPAVFDAQTASRNADHRLNQLIQLGLSIEDDVQHPNLWIGASNLKSRWRRVSLADCFGLSLAIELNAPFWTSDHHELDAIEAAGVADVVFIR